MKTLPILVAAACVLCSPADAGTTIGGTVIINMVGNFKNPVTQQESLSCSAIVSLVPSNLNTAISSLSLGTLLSAIGIEEASADGAVTNGGAAFSCTATVQYRWENIDPNVVQMAIVYAISATDPGGTNHGAAQRLIEIIPIPPARGTTTTLSVNPKL
jgi:hypothetical protein